MKKALAVCFISILLSMTLLNDLKLNMNVLASQNVHVMPEYVDVEIQQTPYTVMVAIVASFNETGIRMDLVDVALDKYGNYTAFVNITRVSGPTAGSFNVSVWTTLGIPNVGNHTLFVKEIFLGTLVESVFNVVPVGMLFSNNGIVAYLYTYMNYTEAEMKSVPPGLYNYTRFLVNSTSPSAVTPGVTMGIRLDNTLTTNLTNVSLGLSPPLGIDFDVSPRNWTYGTLDPSSSEIGFFNITTTDVSVGRYNITYTLNYTNTGEPQNITGVIPVGVCLIKPTWIEINQTAIVETTTPFNDTSTTIFYNYTTKATTTNTTLLLSQNTNSSFTLSNFTGSLQSPFWGWIAGGVTEASAEACRQKVKDGKITDVWNIVVAGIKGIANSFVEDEVLEAGAKVENKILGKQGKPKISLIKAAKTAFEIKTFVDAVIRPLEGMVEGLNQAMDEINAEIKDTQNQMRRLFMEKGKGKVDAAPTTPTGTTVRPPPTPSRYADERERGSWCDEMWFTPVVSGGARTMLMLTQCADAIGEPSPTSIPTVKIVGDGIPTPGAIAALKAAGYPTASTPGFDMSFYAINNRKPPLDDYYFRKALAQSINKEEIYPTLWGPMATPIYSWVPPAQAFWENPTATAAFRGMTMFNLQNAINTLIAGGYIPCDDAGNVVINPLPGNINHWEKPKGTPLRNIEQAVPLESTLSMEVSKWIESDLHSIGLVNIKHTPLPFGYIVYQQWLSPPYLNWDLAIGVELTFGAEPILYEMFHVNSIPVWNIWGLDDPFVNYYCDTYRQTLSAWVARENVWACQERLVEIIPMIPMASSMKWTSIRSPSRPGQPGVLGWVNAKGFGGYNMWSALYSRGEAPDSSPYTINNWLIGGDADTLNPLTSDSAYEWQLLSLVYSTLLIQHPYTQEYLPWCVTARPTLENGRIQLWNGTHRTTGTIMPPESRTWIPDTSPVGSPGLVTGEYMRWTLRDDLTWHDGHPVNAYDVEFCLDLLQYQNNERYFSIQSLIWDVNVVDTYTFDVYYTGRYLWATCDISNVALLAPKHVWGPYIDPDYLSTPEPAHTVVWDGDERDHRFWTGYDVVSRDGYTAPETVTVSGYAQLTHLIGNGPFVYPLGGWQPGVIMQLIRWGVGSWHYRRTLRGDNNLDGRVDVIDLWAPLYAFGSKPGMPAWEYVGAGLRGDMANDAQTIDGRDISKVYDDWAHTWYPTSNLPPP